MKSNAQNHRNLLAILLTCVTLLPLFLSAQDRGVFTDSRDNRPYYWVKVAGTSWMTHNLIFKDRDNSWSYNGDDSVQVYKYGRLYNWKGANEACPKGWKLPSEKDWNKLIENLGADKAGMIVQSWDTVGMDEGSPQFSYALSGVRYTNGVFLNINYWGACWSSTSLNDSSAVNFLFAKGAKSITQSINDKKAGFSVRCIKK